MTQVACSWCHTMAKLPAGATRVTCLACRHDAGVPRPECECDYYCRAKRLPPLTPADLEEMQERIVRRDI